MMICFNCSAELRDDLDQLVTLGGYRGYDEAITLAIRNQLCFEKQLKSSGAIIVGKEKPPSVLVDIPTPVSDAATAKVDHAVQVSPKLTVTSSGRSKPSAKTPSTNGKTYVTPPKTEVAPAEPPSIPALFTLEGFPNDPPAWLADLGPDVWSPGHNVPLDRWVLGQQNRILPAKVNSRALIRLYLEKGKELPLAKTAEQVAKEAARLGDYLVALDARRETSRDDALAIAFPTSGEESEKSRSRYANQFVVYENTRGEVLGLMADLKLINFTFIKKERYLVPTKIAWHLACLPNPIIDAKTGDHQTEKFSKDERELLTAHIAKSVPAEAFAYRMILKAIREGHNTPEKIDAALKAYVTPDRADKLSQSFLSSQRSGAVSRMSDLNLLTRLRDGIRMSYAVTEEGVKFLDLSTPTGGK